MPIVLYEKDGRIARITLDPPEILNAVEADMPTEISDAVVRADAVEYQTGALRADQRTYDWTRDRPLQERIDDAGT